MKLVEQERNEKKPDAKPVSKEELDVRSALAAYDKKVNDEEHLRKNEELKGKFADLVKSTTELGRYLAEHEPRQGHGSDPDGKPGDEYPWRLFFSGFLEGDFADRAYFPISLFGGFFVKTPHGNILFDPGTGTRAGLKEMGLDIPTETDLIVDSHYHFSVRYDLHLTLNEMGAFRPDGATDTSGKRVHFLSTESVIMGRNDHPKVITPPYDRVIDPLVVKPNMAFKIFRQDGQCKIEEYRESDAAPEGDFLLLRTFPAYHDEVACPGEPCDKPAYEGREMSSYFLTDGTFGVFFTGDTEYREEEFERDLKDLAGEVDVLVANMKTIEYLPRTPRADNEAIDPEKLHLTKNQLGFEGVKKLTQLLRPRKLVIRALGLECVVEENKEEKRLDYAPDRLGVYRRWLHHLLTKDSNRTRIEEIDDIVIPIRHEMRVKSLPGQKPEITHHSSISAAPPDDVLTLGEGFVTGNKTLIDLINFYMHILETHERPFIVIEGETGSGKSFLAESIAYEIVKKIYPRRGDTFIKSKIREHDLALQTENDVNRFLSELVGSVPGFFNSKFRGGPGMLSVEHGVLILNQFERLHPSLAKTFLDILQQWQYTELGASTAKPVQVKIIFTTNKQLDAQENLSPDLKNRVRGRLMTIPSLRRLSSKERVDTLSLFISNYCKKRRVQLDSPSWGLLLNADLRDGAIRCLEGLLEKARFFAEEKHRIYKIEQKEKPIVFISKDEVEAAMDENGVRLMRDPFTSGEKVDRRTASVVTIWVSYGCINDATCKELCTGERKSSRSFKLWLQDFRDHFGRSEKAWEYLTTSDAMKALDGGSLDDYIRALGVTDDPADLGRLFNSGNDPQWKEERAKALADALIEHRTKEKFLRKLEKPAKR